MIRPLYLAGTLIPAEFLVMWDDRAREIEIYHIELASHDVLLANGAPAESYRDDGNRWLFQNAGDKWNEPPKPVCAPVLTGGAVVDAVWRGLLHRSGTRLRLPTTGEPDLHLLVDGYRVDGRTLDSGVYVFRLEQPPREVRICSRAAAPDELGFARDPRLLGVALQQIRLWQGRHVKITAADDPSLCEGFHAFEADNGFRWTTGNALLPAAIFAEVSGVCELELHVPCTGRFPLPSAPIRAAA